MDNFAGLYDIRPMVPEDKNFILSTFLRGLYYGDFFFDLIPKQIFMENYKKVGEYLVTNPKFTIKVASLKGDPGVIIGYSITTGADVIHWVYVRGSKLEDGSTWRGHGIARSLLPKSPKSVSHLSTLGKTLLSKFKDCVFNPFEI